MKYRLPILLFLLSFLGSSTHCLAEEIRIGAIASLTGLAGEQGKNWLNGAKLAEDELRAKGIELSLTVEDDGTNPAKAVSAFRKMVDFNHVQLVLGGTWDFLFEALVPLATSTKVPLITMTNPVEIFSKEALASPYIFTNALSLGATEAAMRSFFSHTKPVSLAILSPTFPFTLAHADIAERLAKELKIPVALRVNFSYDDYFQTIKVLAAKTIHSKADLVYIPVGYEALDPFALTIQQQGGKQRLLNTQHLDAAFSMTARKDAYKNAYGLYPQITDNDFQRRYAEKFKNPPRVYSAEGYDALMFAALARAQGIDIATGTKPFHYEGVTGKYSLPASGRQLGQIRAAVMTTRSGKFERAEEFKLSVENHAVATTNASATGETGSKEGSPTSE